MIPPLLSAPEVVVENVVRLMQPIEVFLMATTSTKMCQAIQEMSLPEMLITIYFSKSATIILLEDKRGMSSIVVGDGSEAGRCPFAAAGIIETDVVVRIEDKLSTVLELLSSISRVKLDLLNVQMNEENDYEELAKGISFLESKHCAHLHLTGEDCSVFKPPVFLDELLVDSVYLKAKVTAAPRAMLNAREFIGRENIVAPITNSNNKSIFITEPMSTENAIDFFNNWKSSSEMDELERFYNGSFSISEEFINGIEAQSTTRKLKMSPTEACWVMKRHDGKEVAIEKSGNRLSAFLL